MPTSSKLGKILNLKNQKVYLVENAGKNLRTKYKVHSVLIENNLILLDLNAINDLFFSEILLNNNYYLPERTINDLKIDFVNEEIKEVIEIKGLISEEENILFPHSNANRIIKQLKAFLKFDYKIRFIFVLMNPKINTIKLDKENSEFIKSFKTALKKKVKLEIYRVYWKDTKEHVEEVKYNLKNNIIKIENPI